MAAAVMPSSPLMASTSNQTSYPQSTSPTPARAGPSLSQSPPAESAFPKSLKGRFRSSIEQSIRSATRSRIKSPPVVVDDFATLTPGRDKGKGREQPPEDAPKEKERIPMLKKLESKVSFRTAARSISPSLSSSAAPAGRKPAGPAAPPRSPTRAGSKDDRSDDGRFGGFTPFQAPSLRGASMSSPTLTLSKAAAPSTRSRPAIPMATEVTTSPPPTRERSKRASVQPIRVISNPAPLAPRRVSADATRPLLSREPAKSSIDLPRTADVSRGSMDQSRPSLIRDGSRRAKPPPLYTTPSAPSVPLSRSNTLSPSPMPDTPTRRTRDVTSPPATPTIARTPIGGMRRASASSSALPLSSRAVSPPLDSSTPTPLRARSPSQRRVVTPTKRNLASASSSHLPIGSSSGSRRPSLDAPRPSFMTDSPSSSRANSPNTPYAHGSRQVNASTSSLATATGPPPNPEHRELLRAAASLLCREVGRSSRRSGFSDQDWEEIEIRMRNLVRLERVWGKSGSGSTGANSGTVSSGLSAAGEERERKTFGEALRDGYVLCQFMNKLRPGSLQNPSTRDDGVVRTSNVTRFLATCSTQGVPPEDLFHRDDLLECTPESLARVARAVLSLFRITESPFPDRSKFLGTDGTSCGSGFANGPYRSASRGAASSPNLELNGRSTSPTTPIVKKRWSPPSPGLPTVLDHGAERSPRSRSPESVDSDRVTPLIGPPPPRSPLRSRSSSNRSGLIPSERASLADSTRASLGESVRESLADSVAGRQSLASSTATDTTGYSSLLAVDRTSSGGGNRFGTIRTFTTEATSFVPSETASVRGDALSLASSIADEIGRKPADLTNVAEETEASSSATSSSGKTRRTRATAREETEREPEQQAQTDRIRRVRLGKAKWPDDFLDAFGEPDSAAAALLEEFGGAPTPPLSSSPRKASVLDNAVRSSEGLKPLLEFPRRPTHRPRHSVDAPALLPRESFLRREASPDGGSPVRGMVRRTSTRTSASRNALLGRTGLDEGRSSSSESAPRSPRVPFPRTVSGEHNIPQLVLPTTNGSTSPTPLDRPRVPRGRFQSEVDGMSTRRKPRPSSFDVEGAKPTRSRFESMVNLGVGVGSSNAVASDLNPRDSVDGTTVRQTLIVKEEGRPVTQYQLGNCIGRGQFGSVYRALNLNTGQMVAVKRIRLEGLKEDEIKQLMREVDLVRSLSHPSIVKYEGMARDENTLSIVLEYAENGSLGQTLKAFGKLNERLVASYVVKILEGLHYLHTSDVVHCDLKAANILTTKNGNVKLSDFGVSLNLRAMEREMKDVAGTPNWMAPEVIELKGASYASDIWSLGCTVVELLTGHPPYSEIPNTMSVMFRIVEDDAVPLPEGCSNSLKDFLALCFQKDATKRPSAEDLCEHEWLKNNWVGGKELRQQDSIPFLRRVSTDMHKSVASGGRPFPQIEIPSSEAGVSDDGINSPRVLGRRYSNGPISPRPSLREQDSFVPREHSFVRTYFGKAMPCKVCLNSVKKSAVICETCSLIAHSKCAPNSPPTCDLRAQLLLYAQHVDPGDLYNNAADILAAAQARSAGSSPPTESSIPSPRTSFDFPQIPTTSSATPHPPIAFKVPVPFKRSRSNTPSTPEPIGPATPQSIPPAPIAEEKLISRKRSILKRNPYSHERPVSYSSSSTTSRTNPNTSSMRSAATAAESLSSGNELSRRSIISNADTDIARASRFSAMDADASRSSKITARSAATTQEYEAARSAVPGALPVGEASGRSARKRDKDSKSNSNCVMQ